jgi:hypothetical protein
MALLYLLYVLVLVRTVWRMGAFLVHDALVRELLPTFG